MRTQRHELLWKHLCGSGTIPWAKTVYMYLKDRSNADGTCWPSVRRIAEDLKLSRRTVQRALSDLEHHGFLERTHRRRPNGSLTSSLYRIK